MKQLRHDAEPEDENKVWRSNAPGKYCDGAFLKITALTAFPSGA